MIGQGLCDATTERCVTAVVGVEVSDATSVIVAWAGTSVQVPVVSANDQVIDAESVKSAPMTVVAEPTGKSIS